MQDLSNSAPLRVVVVGGGIAALEVVLALHDLAGDRVDVTLVAPEPDFVLRPLAVATPFGRGHVDRLPLADVMAEHGGGFVRDAVLGVNARAGTLSLAAGRDLAYEVLVLALGASAVPAYTHALTFGEDPGALNGILADLEEGYTRSVAFVVPPGTSWPLPLYELALMTAEEVWSMNMDQVRLHLVTPESAPLEIFGAEVSAAVRELLEAARITTHFAVDARIEHNGRVESGAGPDIVVDRVVALPRLEGPKLSGVSANAGGFFPVDDAGRIVGLDGVYAVGDATDRAVKQGGLACQQADAAAAHIAVRAGADVVVAPLQQILRGRLLTGAGDRFLQERPEPDDEPGEKKPLWWPPEKVSGTYLSPYLAAKDIVHLPDRGGEAGVDVHVELPARLGTHA